MDPGWLQAAGSLLLSLIGGGIAGALVTNYLQNRGDISLTASRWMALEGGDKQPSVGYRFHIVAYNETAMPDGLSECRVVFSKGGEELFTSRPKRENREGVHALIFEDGPPPYRPPLEVIELPPRTPIHVEVRGRVEEPDATRIRKSDKAEFVARSPSKGEKRWEIAAGSSRLFPSDYPP